MKKCLALITCLTLAACTITIKPTHLDEPAKDRTKTMHGVSTSTRIVEGEKAGDRRLVAPVLRKQLGRKNWMEYRLWARKTISRPFAPDLFLEVSTRGPQGTGVYSARDRNGNKLAILSKTRTKGRMKSETVQVTLTPKALTKNNNQGYLVYLRGKVPGSKATTIEIELPAYYHRGFMNRYMTY